jgi:hypothetical protein
MTNKKLEIGVNWPFVTLVVVIVGAVIAFKNPHIVDLLVRHGLSVIREIGNAF